MTETLVPLSEWMAAFEEHLSPREREVLELRLGLTAEGKLRPMQQVERIRAAGNGSGRETLNWMKLMEAKALRTLQTKVPELAERLQSSGGEKRT